MPDQRTVSVLGLGAMGRALAGAALRAGHRVPVWNRTAGKDTDLVTAGARHTATPAAAISGSDLVIVCLLDHASVHSVLDPIAAELSDVAVVNLTSTTPGESRELASWARAHDIAFLDGGIMAVPDMIGGPAASILYSGDAAAFDSAQQVLELFGSAEFLGADPGLAAAHDFALLAAMYAMFAGFAHGAAMLRSAGVGAAAFAERAVPWLTAMTGSLPWQAQFIDSGDYRTSVQNLHFNKAALDAIVRAGREAGIAVDVLRPVKALIDEQVADGYGEQAFARIVEGLRG
ncbi:NAD(P)-dependent oxidoreductase [Nocardia spumae]|uniref:NAD(P)-dependent oxidoreductase n=1 Tax=Nocardia spumae TaxID=2887190 RepID=UPI001D15D67D|nr:NAD(P)-binding domain-containing protein [Nocardia spumae]